MAPTTIPVMRPWLGPEEAAAAAEAIASGWVAQGPKVVAFEQALCGQVGVDHGVAVSSCTAALHLAMVILGLGPGDEVVVPSLSFIATANAVRYVGRPRAPSSSSTKRACRPIWTRCMPFATLWESLWSRTLLALLAPPIEAVPLGPTRR